MKMKALMKHLDACNRSFEMLQVESRKSLNLFSLALRFPDSMEHIADVRLQLDRENMARADYFRKTRRLRVLITGSTMRLSQSERKTGAGWEQEFDTAPALAS
jgi:hypothetical protein